MTITRKFRSVTWAAAVATAALSCYLISHRVSAERNALEEVERDIALAREDILALNTEFETRSRMSQIERWNRYDFELTSPDAAQFLDGEFQLASLIRDGVRDSGDVRLVSAEDEGETEDRRVDEEVFEPADPDTLETPRIRNASYLVPGDNAARARSQRIAFLDDRFRGDIAGRAAAERRPAENQREGAAEE
ncbi:hypothetical protein [Parasphingopyxis marina]|uniref:Cell division protein FtsL n=1 Tax=Parasphingopyxis marina TaxID=2761622 RepID=A0A842HVG2_9SPHN|nr:hypothetical protein [Parasphingopyxis marina]MBC2776952.1 hypothetical protein [Parasphingopyxis marina]